MSNIFYTYFNDSDLCLINNFLLEMGSTFFKKNTQINELPFSKSERCEISICIENSSVVIFSPCVLNESKIQEGYFAAIDSPSSIKQFLVIKKFIKKTFLYSKENRCYYGKGIYNDWLNFKYIFSIMFEFEIINVDWEEANIIFDDLLRKGYKLHPNNVRLRDINNNVIYSDEIIIFPQSAQIMKTIHRKTFIHYEYGSECIFVYKNKKKSFYSFVFDKRFLSNTNVPLIELYNLISKDRGRFA